MFGFVFILVLAFIIVSVIISFYRLLRRPYTQSEERSGIVREREIIKEIVKIRCPYCNNLYDEKYDKCPHCGGKRTP